MAMSLSFFQGNFDFGEVVLNDPVHKVLDALARNLRLGPKFKILRPVIGANSIEMVSGFKVP
jgi:hypothetical protein